MKSHLLVKESLPSFVNYGVKSGNTPDIDSSSFNGRADPSLMLLTPPKDDDPNLSSERSPLNPPTHAIRQRPSTLWQSGQTLVGDSTSTAEDPLVQTAPHAGPLHIEPPARTNPDEATARQPIDDESVEPDPHREDLDDGSATIALTGWLDVHHDSSVRSPRELASRSESTQRFEAGATIQNSPVTKSNDLEEGSVMARYPRHVLKPIQHGPKIPSVTPEFASQLPARRNSCMRRMDQIYEVWERCRSENETDTELDSESDGDVHMTYTSVGDHESGGTSDDNNSDGAEPTSSSLSGNYSSSTTSPSSDNGGKAKTSISSSDVGIGGFGTQPSGDDDLSPRVASHPGSKRAADGKVIPCPVLKCTGRDPNISSFL